MTEDLIFLLFFFFFNDAAPPEIYPLPLPDAFPISARQCRSITGLVINTYLKTTGRGKAHREHRVGGAAVALNQAHALNRHAGKRIVIDNGDRKSTRLNSSHLVISYAVFCLKNKTLS